MTITFITQLKGKELVLINANEYIDFDVVARHDICDDTQFINCISGSFNVVLPDNTVEHNIQSIEGWQVQFECIFEQSFGGAVTRDHSVHTRGRNACDL